MNTFRKGVKVPNRTLCDVLREMLECYKTRNFSYLPGLIGEAQTMANRMEEGLWDQHDVRSMKRELKRKLKELEDQSEKC